MQYSGKVTKIDLEYCRFTLDSKINVYSCFAIQQTKLIRMPALGSIFCISNADLINNTIILTQVSKFSSRKYHFENLDMCREFVSIINRTVLDPKKFINLLEKIETKIIEKFDSKIKSSAEIKLVILKAFTYFACKGNEQFINKLEIYSPSVFYISNECKRIDSNHEWTYGVNCFKDSKVFIGLLYVCKVTGFLKLRDLTYNIIVVIAPSDNINYSFKISCLLDSYVVINNFYYFTEYIRTSNVPIHYIFVNINNVDLVYKSEKPKARKYLNQFYLKVISRCTVSLKDNCLECWLHSEIKTDTEWKQCFIKLNHQNFLKYPLFNNGDVYTISANNDFFFSQIKKFESPKNYKVNNQHLPVFILPTPCDVQYVKSEKQIPLLTIHQTKEIFNKNKVRRTLTTLLSFEGILNQRKTVSQKSATRVSNELAFGMKGNDTHQIVFLATNNEPDTNQNKKQNVSNTLLFYEEDLEEGEALYTDKQNHNVEKENKKYEQMVSIYMHNWEQLQTPLGLIPGMKVSVRYVTLAPSSTYCKPTFISKIEAQEYVPGTEFQTTLEFMGNADWGPNVFLSDSKHIPTSCVCWGKVNNVYFTTITLSVHCNVCNEMYVPGQNKCCATPDSSKPYHLKVFMGLRGKDTSGTFDFLSNSLQVLKVILECNNNYWIGIFKAMFTLKWWTLNEEEMKQKEKFCFMHRDKSELFFSKFLNKVFSSVGKKGINSMDLKCRKLDKQLTDRNQNQKWFAIEARRSSEDDYDEYI